MDINTATLGRSLSQFLHRFHVIIFVIIVCGAVGAGVFINYQKIIATDNANGYVAPASNVTFDSTTRQQLSQLNASDYRLSNPDQPRQLNLDGRVNPFVEN